MYLYMNKVELLMLTYDLSKNVTALLFAYKPIERPCHPSIIQKVLGKKSAANLPFLEDE